jgi:ribonucleotide monophosphatase NagD (HAD superfamily)
VPVSPRIRPYDHVLLDLDGCLWVGDEACEGAAGAVTALREAGTSLLFLTNDVRHAPEEFVRKLWRLGFQAPRS